MKRSIVKESVIVRFFTMLTNYVYYALFGGLLGKVFTS